MFCILILPINASKIIYKMNIKGTSMYPTNQDNSIFFVHTITAKDVKINDVICFNYDKRNYVNVNTRYICHRIIDKTKEHICTKGDNNKYSDNCFENKYVALKVLV